MAERLHMTVARLRTEMSAAEYVQWLVYFGRRQQERELAEQAGGR